MRGFIERIRRGYYHWIENCEAKEIVIINSLFPDAVLCMETALVSDTHKSADFIEFLKILDQKYPEGDTIRLILDNHSAHTSKETKKYLATLPRGRFEFVFTPTHSSWLNMIESFFSKMTKQMLKGIRVNSKEELSARIYQYFEEINADPVVYHWTYKMDEINADEASRI